MLGIAVIGYGYWGPNLVRNFMQADGARVVAVCDPVEKRRAQVQGLYPTIKTYANITETLADPNVNAVVIATPVSSHFELAMQALQAGKHVLVEKPMTNTVEHAERLIEEAEKRKLTLMVDHTFCYTSVVGKIRELVSQGSLGQLFYYDSVRVNLGLFQHDVNVLWDLAVHDLSIMDFVLGRPPKMIAATGVASVPGQPESLAYLTCFFGDNLLAHFHVNWLAPVKIRKTLIGGSHKMIEWDDMELSEKLRVYDKGITVASSPENIYQLKVGYRAGDMWAPHIPNVEALQVEARHFVECATSGRKPTTDGHSGLRVVKILEAASKSVAQHGHPIEI
ncbi:MAG TPA: Gfo/Idh/MocA family oxidoreductase [Polyangiaceae bacterium]